MLLDTDKQHIQQPAVTLPANIMVPDGLKKCRISVEEWESLAADRPCWYSIITDGVNGSWYWHVRVTFVIGNTHRRRNSTRQLSCVGGVYWVWETLPVNDWFFSHSRSHKRTVTVVSSVVFELEGQRNNTRWQKHRRSFKVIYFWITAKWIKAVFVRD